MASQGSGLEGLSAIVTGGGSGIGLAAALEMQHRGARVSIVDLNVDEVPPVLGRHVADVRSREDIERAVAQTVAAHGSLDVVVNCAGIPSRGPLASLTDEEWTLVYDVNVIGFVRMIRAALPHLRASSDAAIVNLASVSANIGLAGISAYAASKGAIHALTRALAAEFRSDGIRVNSVSPGTVDTPWIRRYFASLPDPAAAEAAAHARQPTGRMVSAQEVAEVVCHLASRHARSITGTDVAIDGGMSTVRME